MGSCHGAKMTSEFEGLGVLRKVHEAGIGRHRNGGEHRGRAWAHHVEYLFFSNFFAW